MTMPDPSTFTVELKAQRRTRMGEQQEAFTSSEMGVSGEEILGYIERIERLEQEKASLGDDIKDVCAEAKARGLSAKAIRAIIKLRKLDPEERQASEAILDLYKQAIGMN
jgi:uncharacterized protein (UPF0335 family)